MDYAGSMTQALTNVQDYFQEGGALVPVVVEVRSMSELDEALVAASDVGLTLTRLLLDNFTPEEVNKAVRHVGGRLPLEASGGIDLTNLRAYGDAGVDFVSMGSLTHSVKSLDLSLKTRPNLAP